MDAYKIFKQLQEREKRANPYSFYDKDELIDEILKLEDKIDKAIELIKRSAGYKGICTQPDTDTFSKLLEILGGNNE